MTVLIGVKIGSWGGDRHQVHPLHRFATDRKPVVSDNGGLDESYPSTCTYFVGLKESDGIKKWGGIEGVKNVRLVQYKLQ